MCYISHVVIFRSRFCAFFECARIEGEHRRTSFTLTELRFYYFIASRVKRSNFLSPAFPFSSWQTEIIELYSFLARNILGNHSSLAAVFSDFSFLLRLVETTNEHFAWTSRDARLSQLLAFCESLFWRCAGGRWVEEWDLATDCETRRMMTKPYCECVTTFRNVYEIKKKRLLYN